MGTIIVVGGGLVGCLLSIYLARRGFRIAIYERHCDPRLVYDEIKRPSINLTLCARGLKSLKRVGVLDSLQGFLTPAYGRVVHLADGTLSFQHYGEPGEAIYSIRRKDLNIVLLAAAEELSVSTHFDLRCVDFEPEARYLKFIDAAGVFHETPASCVIAADGSSSVIRSCLHARGLLHQIVQFSANSYKTLTIPKRDAGLQEGAIHVWPRKQCMAIAFPNPSGSFSVAFHLPVEGDPSFKQLVDVASVQMFLASNFPDLFPRLRGAESEFLAQRPSSMLTVRCNPWGLDKVLLVGDAAHSILPHYGQGANAGFEDCEILAGLIDRHGPDWRTVLRVFEERRRGDTDAISELCNEHAHNLHHSIDSSEFQLRLHLERRLHHLFPTRFIPLYSMISFSSMPYAELQARDRIQRKLISDLMSHSMIGDLLEHRSFVASIQERIEHDLPAAVVAHA